MVELLAENYHNIWAKKKKSDLAVKGSHSCKVHFLSCRVFICMM